MSTEFINDQWRLPNAWNGTESNVNKQSNYSMDFDGSSQYIDTTDKFDFIHNTKIFSISVWVKMDSYSDNTLGLILGNNYTGSNSQSGFMFWTDNRQNAAGRTEALNFNLWDGTNTTFLNIENVVNDNNWHNYIVVGDGTTLKYYKDGTQLSNTASLSASTSTTAFANLRLGANTYSPPSIYLNGKIDAVAIYNYELSSSQITTLYGSSSTGIGNPMSLSPKPVFYAPLGDQDAFNGANYLVPNSSLKDYVFDFDAANNEYIDLGTTPFSFTQNLTISFWVKTSQTAPNSLIGKDNNVINVGRNWMVYSDSGIVKFWTTSSGSVSTLSLIESNTLVNDNQWHHIVCVNDYVNSTKQIYIDGSLDITNNNGAAISTSYSPVRIGIRDTTPQRYPYDGLMSNVALWDTALTGPQAETLYNNGSPIETLANIPQNSNLQGWWKLDASATYDLSTNTWTIPDDSTNSNDGTSSGMTQANLVQSDLSFTSGYSPYALDFDSASSDYIDCGDSDDFSFGNGTTDSPFSVSFFVNLNSYPQYNCVFVSKDDGSPNREYGIGMFGNTYVRFFIKNAGGNNQQSVDSTTTIALGSWYHVVATYDGRGDSDAADGMNLYINSINETTGAVYQSYNAMANTTAPFRIGQYANVAYVDGKISNVSVWNTELTSAQVSELYNEGVPSNLNNHSAYSNLVSWWQLGSNSSFNSSLNQWTCIDEKGTNTGESSQTFNEDAIVDGVGSYANGLSSGMGGDEVIGDAPYSTANSLSVNMDVEDRVTGISNATITTGGTGYATGTNITTTGGTGSGCTVDITASGAMTAVTINNSGLGYSVGEVLTVVQSGGSSGTITVTSLNTPS